uniref:Uncharacterized protein n=1 Tax=Oryza glumipatula TaxID=40148 RepID=A0A0D9YBJ1_9ORYZ
MCLLPANSHTPFPSPNGGGAARRRDRLSRSPGWPRGVHRAARHLRAQLLGHQALKLAHP